MGKRGQATTFVLLGLIILVLVIGIAITTREAGKTVREKELTKAVSLPAHIRPVYDLIDGCVKDTGRTGLYLIGLQGGYVEPEKYIETDLTKVGFGYYVGQKVLPTKEKISNEFSKFMSTLLVDCADFSQFKDLKISPGTVSSRLFINDDNANVEVFYPLIIEKSDSEFKLNEKYSVSYPIRLGRIYDFASSIIDKEIDDPEKIDLTFLLESGYDVTVIPVDDSSVIYSITDKQSSINDIPYTFMFSNKF